jgi:hypothetical protein
MAEPAVARPALALDTTIEFGFDPANVVRTRRHRPQPSPGCQTLFEFEGLGSGEALG